MRFSILLLLAVSSLASAEEHVISAKAPVGLEELSTEIEIHSISPKNGHHGLKENCYKSDSYIVYSTNLLGHGYELSLDPPSNIECTKPEFRVLAKNKLGMFIGMKKSEVEELIGVPALPDEKTIIWLSQIIYKGNVYDHQVYVQLKFNKERLTWVSVFTTETS
jgi:hypothetical protein